MYQIEEDVHINFEALVKREQRFKKKMNADLFANNALQHSGKKNPNNSLQILSSPVSAPIATQGCLFFAN
jgi:hypothetical protein